jgi:hypothetical protein
VQPDGQDGDVVLRVGQEQLLEHHVAQILER